MKKKLNLVQLNNNETRKNQLKQLLSQDLDSVRGGAKCPSVRCDCWCDPYNMWDDDTSTADDNQNAIQDSWF